MRRVIVPPNPGILCAQGLLNSDLVVDFVQSALAPFGRQSIERINAVGHDLLGRANAWFEREKVGAGNRHTTWSIDLRYAGQNFELSIPCPAPPLAAQNLDRIAKAFHAAHDSSYGFRQDNEPIEFVSLRVNLAGILEKPALAKLSKRPRGKPVASRKVAFTKDARLDAPVYWRPDLAPGQKLTGPAIIEQMDCSTPIFPRDRLQVDDWGNLVVDLAGAA